MGKISLQKKKMGVFFVTSWDLYAISSPYTVSFHISGGANLFLFLFCFLFFCFFSFSFQKVDIVVKNLIFEVLVYFISLDDAVPENNKFDFTWRSLYFVNTEGNRFQKHRT